MNHFFESSYSILSGSLRPWLKENQDEEKFIHLLNARIRKNKDDHQSFFRELGKAFKSLNINIEDEILSEALEFSKISTNSDLTHKSVPIDLPKFFNKQTEFYAYLIKNEYFSILNGIYSDITSLDEDHAKYKLYHIFKKIEELINHSGKVSNNDNITTFVITTLKLNLFHIYFETQRLFPQLIDFEVLAQSEVLHLLAPNFEDEKEKSNTFSFFLQKYLQNVSTFTTPPQPSPQPQAVVSDIKKPEKKQDKPPFTVRKEDFRSGYSGKLSWDDITKKEQFSRFEERLYEYDFIDLDYNFTKVHDRKKELAAIIKLLIQKDYFKKTNRKRPKRNFDPAHYRQYLDHRYNTNTSQQFSRITDDEIKQVEYKYHWLNNI
jgi:hypothetical protein